jgi:iron(III) transport system permease protein
MSAQRGGVAVLDRAAPPPGPAERRRWHESLTRATPAPVVGLVIVALTIPPLVTVFVRSLYTTDQIGNTGELTAQNYLGLLTQSGLPTTLLNTASMGVGATAIALVIGGGLAWVCERTNAPGARLCQAGMLLSLAFPYVLYTIAWIMLLGQSGPVNTILQAITGSDSPVVAPYNLAVMIGVEGLVDVPLAFLLLSAVFRSIDPSLEESATVCGAGTMGILRRVSGPLIRPGLLAVALLVFIRSLEAFEIPALIGLPGNIRVMTTSIYQDTKDFPPDYGTAGAYAVVLMVLVGGLLLFSRRLTRNSRAFATVTGKGFRTRRSELGRGRYVGTVMIAAYLVLGLLAPFAIVLWAASMPFYVPPSMAAIDQIGMANFETVLSSPQFVLSLRNTLVVGVGSALAVMVLASATSWIVVKRRSRGGVLLEQLSGIPLVVPGVIMGFSIAALYLALPLPVYGTLWILAIGYVTRYLPYGMRYAQAGLVQVHEELEEAALVSGASTLQSLRVILLPLASPTLFAGLIFVFLTATKELSMSVLLASPDTEVLSVTLYNQWVNGQTTLAAAFGTLWTIVLGIFAAVLLAIGRRRGLRLDM